MISLWNTTCSDPGNFPYVRWTVVLKAYVATFRAKSISAIASILTTSCGGLVWNKVCKILTTSTWCILLHTAFAWGLLTPIGTFRIPHWCNNNWLTSPINPVSWSCITQTAGQGFLNSQPISKAGAASLTVVSGTRNISVNEVITSTIAVTKAWIYAPAMVTIPWRRNLPWSNCVNAATSIHGATCLSLAAEWVFITLPRCFLFWQLLHFCT